MDTDVKSNKSLRVNVWWYKTYINGCPINGHPWTISKMWLDRVKQMSCNMVSIGTDRSCFGSLFTCSAAGQTFSTTTGVSQH